MQPIVDIYLYKIIFIFSEMSSKKSGIKIPDFLQLRFEERQKGEGLTENSSLAFLAESK